MIVELVGLSGTGKSTYARKDHGQRIVRIRAPQGTGLILPNVAFAFRFPLQALSVLSTIMRHAPRGARYTLFVNAFLVVNAKYMQARKVSRTGHIALIDQGHWQNMLIIFGHTPAKETLMRLAKRFPRTDMVLLREIDESVRLKRLAERGWRGREGRGAGAAERADQVARETYPGLKALAELLVSTAVIDDDSPILAELLTGHITYTTFARMPTEKAHGASIAHMCAAFAAGSAQTSLYLPARTNPITEDLFSHYRIPRTFSVEHLSVFDFLGKGMSHPFFFLLQRFLFARSLVRTRLAGGIVYTRDPEIVFMLGGVRPVVFEAHRMPAGFWGRLTAHLVKKAALVVCNSKGTAEAFQGRGIANTIVAPNGFDAVAFKNAESKDASRKRLGMLPSEQVALYVGSLEKWKGVQTLYDASELLSEIRVAVIGGSVDEVQKLQKRYPRVLFLGARPYAELANNLAAADVLVLPNTRHDAQSAMYTSPIKLFGYLASGKPVVASDLPSIRAIVSDAEVLFVEPDNPPALALAIETLMHDAPSRESLGRAGKEFAQRFTWTARAHTILEAL